MSDTAENQQSVDQIVAVIDRGPGRQIQVRLNEFKGKRYVDLRQFYLDEEQEVYKPTQKGVSIPVEQFGELKEALAKLEPLL
ncbi:MAG TPA: transcriptional coactivator p15/PC4 family protein [Candidatus Bipolaricaulota bacterium]